MIYIIIFMERKENFMGIPEARTLVKRRANIRAAVIKPRREDGRTALLWNTFEEGGKKFVEFFELAIADKTKARVFKSLDAAESAILDRIGLKRFLVTNMTVEEFKQLVLSNEAAEERR